MSIEKEFLAEESGVDEFEVYNTFCIKDDDIPSLEDVMKQVCLDFEKQNKPTYQYLSENEDEEFVKKLIEFAEEVSELTDMKTHKQNIIDDNGFKWKHNEEYIHSDVILCDFNQTVDGGYRGDDFSGFAYVKLPKSGKVFQFEYSM